MISSDTEGCFWKDIFSTIQNQIYLSNSKKLWTLLYLSNILPFWLFLLENNINRPVILSGWINCYPRYSMKSKINLLLPFSISSRSSATASHMLLTNLFFHLFAYHTVLDTVLFFQITGPPSPISKGVG